MVISYQFYVFVFISLDRMTGHRHITQITTDCIAAMLD